MKIKVYEFRVVNLCMHEKSNILSHEGENQTEQSALFKCCSEVQQNNALWQHAVGPVIFYAKGIRIPFLN